MQHPVVMVVVIETHANMRKKDNLKISADVVLSLLCEEWGFDDISIFADIVHNDIIRYLTVWLCFWPLKLPTRCTLCPTSHLHPHCADLRDVVHASVAMSRGGTRASHPWRREQEAEVERWGWGRLVAIDLQ